MASQLPRRRFFSKSLTATAGLSLLGWQHWAQQSPLTAVKQNPTIEEIVNAIIDVVPGGALNPTVDTYKSGNPQQVCRGIVTTFLATTEVIQKTADLGANLIITHEPTYYNHLDETEWLQQDEVYLY